MPSQYAVSWTEENWYEVFIEAESEEEALQKFDRKVYDPTTGSLISKIHLNGIRKSD